MYNKKKNEFSFVWVFLLSSFFFTFFFCIYIVDSVFIITFRKHFSSPFCLVKLAIWKEKRFFPLCRKLLANRNFLHHDNRFRKHIRMNKKKILFTFYQRQEWIRKKKYCLFFTRDREEFSKIKLSINLWQFHWIHYNTYSPLTKHRQ